MEDGRKQVQGVDGCNEGEKPVGQHDSRSFTTERERLYSILFFPLLFFSS